MLPILRVSSVGNNAHRADIARFYRESEKSGQPFGECAGLDQILREQGASFPLSSPRNSYSSSSFSPRDLPDYPAVG